MNLTNLLTITTIAVLASTASFAKSDIIGGDFLESSDIEPLQYLEGCTASLIGPRVVITAAHCIEGSGMGSISIKSLGGMFKKVIAHPSAFPLERKDLANDFAGDYDLAIAILHEESTTFPLTVNMNPETNIGDQFLIVGAGGPHFTIRQFAYMSLVHESSISLTLRGDSIAGAPGDSGGGLLKKYADGRVELIAVTSTSTRDYDFSDQPVWGPLAKPFTTGFTKLSATEGLTSFLEDVIAENEVEICGINLICEPIYFNN